MPVVDEPSTGAEDAAAGRSESAAAATTVNGEVKELLECTVCTELLLDPVTTPCGHSFCRTCLRQSMDHSTKCPVCRTVLLLSHAAVLPVNVTLAVGGRRSNQSPPPDTRL